MSTDIDPAAFRWAFVQHHGLSPRKVIKPKYLPEMSIEYFRSYLNGQFYFRFVARNGKTIAQSEGYKRKAGMMKTIKRYWPKALLEEVKSPSL